LTISVFESESGQKYENKRNINDIRPYPIRFHPQAQLKKNTSTWLSLFQPKELQRSTFGQKNYREVFSAIKHISLYKHLLHGIKSIKNPICGAQVHQLTNFLLENEHPGFRY
jgi:hypothetical protein